MKRNVVIVAVVGWVIAVASIVTVIAVGTGGPEPASADRGGRGESRADERPAQDEPRQAGGEVPELDRIREQRHSRRPRRQGEPDWRESALHSDLQTLRSQLELYKIQHRDNYPGVRDGRFDGRLFAEQLLHRTNAEGQVSRKTRGGDFPYGPYLQNIPANPFVPESVASEIRGGAGPCPGDRTSGWWFDTGTGRLDANGPDHKDL
jgi:hypothetical protein